MSDGRFGHGILHNETKTHDVFGSQHSSALEVTDTTLDLLVAR